MKKSLLFRISVGFLIMTLLSSISGDKTKREISISSSQLFNPYNELASASTKSESKYRGIPLSCYAPQNEVETLDSIELSDISLEYLKTGEYSKSLSFAETIEISSLRDDTLAEIAISYTKAGQYDKAISISQKVASSYHRDRILAEIINQYAFIRKYKQAFFLTKNIEEEEFKAIALARIASSYFKNSQNKQAVELFSQSLQIIRNMPDDFEFNSRKKIEALIELSSIYASIDEYNQAFLMADSIKDIKAKLTAFHTIAKTYIEKRKFDKAVSILSKATRIIKTWKSSPLDGFEAQSRIALDYVEIGLDNNADSIIETLKNKSWKAFTLTDVASRYIDLGQKEQAINTLNRSLLLTQSLDTSDDAQKPFILIKISSQYGKLERRDRMSEVINQSLKIVNTAKNTSFKDEALNQIASQYATVGQYDQAVQIAQTIKDPLENNRLLKILECAKRDLPSYQSAVMNHL